MNVDSIIRKRDGLLTQNVDDATVLGNAATGCYFGVDQIARRIWQLLDQPRTVDALCEALLQEYEIDPEVCQKDVMEFVNELSREGLIEIV
jgi:hypothetical protein